MHRLSIKSVRVRRRFNPELGTSAHPAGRQQLSAVRQMGSSRMVAVKWPASTITSSRLYIWRAINSRTLLLLLKTWTRSPAVAGVDVLTWGGLTWPWLWRSSDPNLVMKFGTKKSGWAIYLPNVVILAGGYFGSLIAVSFHPPAHPMVITLPFTCSCGQSQTKPNSGDKLTFDQWQSPVEVVKVWKTGVHTVRIHP